MRCPVDVRVRVPPEVLGGPAVAWVCCLWLLIALSLRPVSFFFLLGVPVVWSSSRRRERFNPDWQRTRRIILKRDGYRCQWPVKDDSGNVRLCGAPANEVDHKRRDGVHDDDSPDNLWALCHWHHQRKTERESAEARRRKSARRKENQWYSHPAFK